MDFNLSLKLCFFIAQNNIFYIIPINQQNASAFWIITNKNIMKNILNLILLLPLLLYVVILLINNELLSTKAEVNLFFASFEINIVTFISIFFVLYILIIYWIFKFSNFFVSHKNNNLQNKVNELKAQMQDREPKLLENIEKKFSEILEKAQKQNKENIEILKKENDKVVTNLTYDLKIVKEKIENLNK